VPLLFAATLFVSAFLLFLVQPMIAQIILPLLGGTPAVWNTCMVFFQAALLAGYFYTHSATTYFPVKRQTLVQGVLLILPLALFMLPFSIGNWTPATEVNPIWSVLYILLLVVGLPFFVVATSAPLLQRWFSSTGHSSAKDPYFLYGASNLGSMLALLSYPFVFQRIFELPELARVWTIGYAALIVLVGICAFVVWRAPRVATIPVPATENMPVTVPTTQSQQSITRRTGRQRAKPVFAATVAPVATAMEGKLTWLRRLRWTGLAAGPSSLMLGVTAYMTTDIAPIPLIWIVPLTLYLLSFILVFSRWPLPWTGSAKVQTLIRAHALVSLILGATAVFMWELSWFWISLLGAYVLAFVVLFLFCPGLGNGFPHRMLAYIQVPVTVLLGVFAFFAWDVPFGWIIPVGLFLLPSSVLFARWPIVPLKATPHQLFVYLQPIAVLSLGMIAFGAWTSSPMPGIVGNLLAFFTCVMVCHGELARDRPSARHLTEFYLWMAVGGVVGGLFNGLIAPVVFKHIIEYFVVLILVLFLRPQTHFWTWVRGKPEPGDDHSWEEYLLDIGYAACLGLLAYALLKLSLSKTFWRPAGDSSESYDLARYLWDKYESVFKMERRDAYTWARWTELLLIEGIPAVICLAFAGRPLRIGLSVIGLVLINFFMLYGTETDYIYQNRSFFGVQRIRRDESKYGTYNVLIHGSIDHGRQNIDPAVRDRPISYFFPSNPCGQVITQVKEMESNPPYAVVGLGTGTLASYANKGQVLHFYEIDPAVLRLSEPPEGQETYFWYLQDARKRGVDLTVKLGDGRLRLKEAPDHYYQVIVLDAFSSDAIPVHLMTKEAIKLYLSKLKEDGILIFNITNRYVELAPVLSDLARDSGLICLEQGDDYDARQPEKFSTDWAIMFRKREDTPQMFSEAASLVGALQPGMLASVPWAGVAGVMDSMTLEFPPGLPKRLDATRWHHPVPTGRPAWTDHYQDVIPALYWYQQLERKVEKENVGVLFGLFLVLFVVSAIFGRTESLEKVGNHA
jgi:hypothetical protein